jgi:hypothetical protein
VLINWKLPKGGSQNSEWRGEVFYSFEKWVEVYEIRLTSFMADIDVS